MNSRTVQRDAPAPWCARLAGLPLILLGVIGAAAFFFDPDGSADGGSSALHAAWMVLHLSGGFGVVTSKRVGWLLAVAATLSNVAGILYAYVMAGGGDPTLLVLLLPGFLAMLAAFLWPSTIRWAIARDRRSRRMPESVAAF